MLDLPRLVLTLTEVGVVLEGDGHVGGMGADRNSGNQHGQQRQNGQEFHVASSIPSVRSDCALRVSIYFDDPAGRGGRSGTSGTLPRGGGGTTGAGGKGCGGTRGRAPPPPL